MFVNYLLHYKYLNYFNYLFYYIYFIYLNILAFHGKWCSLSHYYFIAVSAMLQASNLFFINDLFGGQQEVENLDFTNKHRMLKTMPTIRKILLRLSVKYIYILRVS
jgi:hypothetical protein